MGREGWLRLWNSLCLRGQEQSTEGCGLWVLLWSAYILSAWLGEEEKGNGFSLQGFCSCVPGLKVVLVRQSTQNIFGSDNKLREIINVEMVKRALLNQENVLTFMCMFMFIMQDMFILQMHVSTKARKMVPVLMWGLQELGHFLQCCDRGKLN